MFDKKIMTITSLVVSEVNLIQNLHTTHRVCAAKGGKSRWPKSVKKLPRKKLQREKGTNA
jgi:hypothetical protein